MITDESGKRLVGASVTFRNEERPVGYYGDSPFTDKDGRYRNRHVPLDTRVEVAVSAEGYLSSRRNVTFTTPGQLENLDFKLSERPKGGSIKGFVTDPQDKVITGATVITFGNEGNIRDTTSDQQGRFILHDLIERDGSTKSS